MEGGTAGAAAQILSHPFRLLPNGRIATVEQTSDEAHAEQLAVLLLTRIGERPLEPGFGITDPTFGSIRATEIAAGVAAYGPPVSIVDVTSVADDDSTQLVEVQFATTR